MSVLTIFDIQLHSHIPLCAAVSVVHSSVIPVSRHIRPRQLLWTWINQAAGLIRVVGTASCDGDKLSVHDSCTVI